MFLIQDGHQAQSRVAPTVEAHDADGVIWSLADETPSNLEAVLSALPMQAHGVVQAVDPQLYVAPLGDANPKKLLDHGLFDVPMRPRDFSARNLVSLVGRLVEFQAARPVTHILSPTVAVASMADRWAGVAADLADTALDVWSATGAGDTRPLLLTVAIQDSLLSDPENVDALLDELTAYECDGFYLLIEIDPKNDPAAGADLFAQALYIVYTLAVVNEYTVWVGYSGLNGFVYRAVGAHAFAGGWWLKQNWWSPAHWTPGAGGRTPRPRIYLESVLGPLLIDVELAAIARQRTDATLAADLLAGAGVLAEAFRRGRTYNSVYERSEMTAQFFAVCSALDDRISGNVEQDLQDVLTDITSAQDIHSRMSAVGVEVEAAVRNALVVWERAIRNFGRRIEVSL